jgi:flagellar basal-body rod protein FlgG
MAISAMYSAATGMDAQLISLDTIANNLANASTTGFKRSRVDFEDVYYQYLKPPGSQDANGKLTPVGVAEGLGVKVSATAVDHTQGNLLQTGMPYDVAIEGDGFFQVEDTTETLYTRAGAFSLNSDGELVMQSAGRGRRLLPNITIPPDTLQVTISSNGIVEVIQPGSPNANQVGQLETARFVNPQGLIQRGDNLYAISGASGSALTGAPGLEGRGNLLQGFLEASNTEPVKEIVELIKTQRVFELNSQVVNAADQSLQLISNLRRF